ncbi:rhomboid family intramembrane serine protease [Halopiger djelfimassiliensis]|uniref:rhomboid family intramembrane serine protease n=1 Tax=Halopiger djelfimassiliensis TaxID=1293047 RepID=UPI0006781747|nr:rhomboid family intramembrane serine protease [Halopiger djelfimassiliensis]
MSAIGTALTLLVAATLALSVGVVNRLHRSERRWRDVATDRLVLGVPWGTLVVLTFVFCVYLFVQDGSTDFSDPVTIPYRAWSYFSPLGIATASFAHASPGHLVGNMAGTAVAAPIAEYAWGHYSGDRGEEPASWWTTPWVRAFVLFPGVVIAVGLITSLFSLGPVIGFSGVVFAFAAFALVHYPITTVVAMLGVQGMLLTIYRALRTPIHTVVAQPSPPSPPSWAGIAIQGHALGFFIGLVLGILLLDRRGRRPDALRLWLAVLLFAFSKGLWQIYWFGQGNTFILFQGPGVVIVTTLALVITLALTASENPLVPRRLERAFARGRESGDRSSESPLARPLELAVRSGEAGAPRLDRIRDLASGGEPTAGTDDDRGFSGLSSVSRRGAAFMAVLAVLSIVAGMAVPVNLLVLEDASATSSAAVEIEDYTVDYAENVENELVSGIGIDAVADDAGLEASGVIVASERRNIWQEVVTKSHLAFTGHETVAVGGPGWRETVHVERTGWEPVGNATVYQVRLWTDGDDPSVAYESNESRADVRIDDRTVTVASSDGTFVLEVQSNETGTVTTPIPDANESTTAGGITFERDVGTIYAVSNGTELAVASEESYN